MLAQGILKPERRAVHESKGIAVLRDGRMTGAPKTIAPAVR